MSAYSSAVLADSPSRYYRLAETSGTTMLDSSGGGRNGTYFNSPTLGATGLVVGDTDTAVTFNGTSHVGQAPHDAAVDDGLTAFTVEALVKPSTATGERTIASLWQSSPLQQQWTLRLNAGELQFNLYQGGTILSFATGVFLAAGTTYHVAATFDGSNVRLYRGVLGASGTPTTLVGTFSAPGTLGTSTALFMVGARRSNVTTAFFAGTIDEVATYPSVFSESKLAARWALANGTTLVNGGTVHEADAAKAGSVTRGALLVQGGTAHETDSARAGSVTRGALAVSGGTAHETDTPRAGSVTGALSIAGGTAHETDAAKPGTTVQAGFPQNVPGGTAHEADAAKAGTVARGAVSVNGGTAHESDTLHVGSLTLGTFTVNGSTVHEAEMARLGAVLSGAASVAGGTAFEVDTARSGIASTTGSELDGGVGFAPDLPDITVPAADVPDPSRLIHMLAISVPPVELENGRPTQAWKDQAQPHYGVLGAYRLFVNGEDVTDFRGYPFQIPSRNHEDPFGHGATDLVLPGVTPWDIPNWGTGDLSWKKPSQHGGEPVVLQIVDPDGIDRTIWRGFVGSVDPQPDGLKLTCAGHGKGRLEAAVKTPRPFMFRKDAGTMLYDLVRRPGLRVTPTLGLDTGVVLDERSRSGGTLLECANEVMALAQQPNGDQVTIMPVGTHLDTYQMRIRDEGTIHATVFYGAHGIVPDLQANLLDKPTTRFAVGRESDGGVWANLKAPGMFYAPPPPFPGTISPGDATDSDDPDYDTQAANVNIWQATLIRGGYLHRDDSVGGFTAATVDATKELQEDAGLAQTGVVNLATWNAGYDVGVTGFSLAQAHAAPMAQLNAVKRYNTTAQGAIASLNDDYDPERPDVQVLTQYGVHHKAYARKREKALREKTANAKMWLGTLRLDTDLFLGDYHHGDPDPVLLSRFMPLAGLNIMFRGWDGDVLLHVASDQKDTTGTTLQVDTMGRPALEVEALWNRNQEGRENPARTFKRQVRGIELGGVAEWWSEIGGEIAVDQPIQGGRWNVIDPVVVGDMGTLSQTALEMEDAVEFACALFAVPVNDGWVNANLPDPFDVVGKLRNLRITSAGHGYESAPTVEFSGGGGSGAHAVAHVTGGRVTSIEWTSKGTGYTSAPSVSLSGGGGSGASADVGIGGTGSKAWKSDEIRDMAKRRRILLEAWGDNEQPCGYGDGTKTDGDTLDGTFVDASGLPYRTYAADDVNNGKRCALYWAIFPKSDTVVKKGRSLWPNPEVGM